MALTNGHCAQGRLLSEWDDEKAVPMPPPRTIDPSLRQAMRLVDFIGCPTTHCANLLAKTTSTSGCKQLLAIHVPCAVMKALCISQRRPGCE